MSDFVVDPFFNELLSVTRQAVEYTREYANKPAFVDLAERFLILAKAIKVARTAGAKQGWDLFDIGEGHWAVQSDDDQCKITDLEAIKLAQLAGLRVDEYGNLLAKDGCLLVYDVVG